MTLRAFPDQFDRMGDFEREEDLEVKGDARESIDSPRKTPIHIKDTLKASLDQMEADGVIRKVTEYMEWCSSLEYSRKKDGSLRLCIDTQKLTESLQKTCLPYTRSMCNINLKNVNFGLKMCNRHLN